MLVIQNKLVDDLIEYENNPRVNDEAIDVVGRSIKEFGFKVPVIVDANNVIVAGHTRVKACKKLGIKEVPCIIADDLTEDQLKAFRLADNKTHEFALWDDEKLFKELE
ncbi:MAG TPA: ParB N-terminal domain-containing protein, partial [Acholeplasma sp.]